MGGGGSDAPMSGEETPRPQKWSPLLCLEPAAGHITPGVLRVLSGTLCPTMPTLPHHPHPCHPHPHPPSGPSPK